jgi:UDP-N-acetylglucosamine 2-epimerase
MRIATIVGTRPQLIKLAALQPALRARHDELLIDTGQHYDTAMAGAFFAELGLPMPHHSLDVGGGGGADQVGRMLVGLEPILAAERPDAVLVVGDTNSTLAGALAGAKLGIPVAHVEAGLRSFDRSMPEEVNRVVADHLARWCFAPTPTALANLAAEGIVDGVSLVGDLMQDLAARIAPEVRDPASLRDLPPEVGSLTPGGYFFATIHRAENRAPEAIAAWAALVGAVASADRPVILALHPGTRVALERSREPLGPHVRVVEPLGYRGSLAAQLHAAAVLTDSGGVQREAAWLGVPCLVLRGTTEWVEAVAGSQGRMAVVGRDTDRALAELARIAPVHGSDGAARERALAVQIEPAGAAEKIAEALSGSRVPA